MADNNKISIDVEINASGQQQITQYGKAFDSLRNSIPNLSTPINALDKTVSNLTNTIKDLSEQNNSISSTITNVGGAFSNVKSIFEGVEKTFKILKVEASSFTAALTGGLSIVLAFLPEIIELTKTFFKNKETISDWAQNFKNLSGVMKAANTDAAEQTTKLNLLYRAATGVNTAGQERLKYAQQLKDTFPEQFKNFDREQIANGKAKGAYNDLAKSILASAKAKAALNKMSEETAKILGRFTLNYQVPTKYYLIY
jgi:ABC-type transporter Mla subunit MlaD